MKIHFLCIGLVALAMTGSQTVAQDAAEPEDPTFGAVIEGPSSGPVTLVVRNNGDLIVYMGTTVLGVARDWTPTLPDLRSAEAMFGKEPEPEPEPGEPKPSKPLELPKPPAEPKKPLPPPCTPPCITFKFGPDERFIYPHPAADFLSFQDMLEVQPSMAMQYDMTNQ